LQDKIATGISIPKNLKDRIDHDRGDVSRSRFILRILEKIYGREENNAPNESRGQPQTHSASSSTSKPQGDLQVA
jgi:metal-responsive CopG/Arc/MetJ family transcriptional regulator